MNIKAKLRQEYREWMSKLPESYRREADKAICGAVCADLAFAAARTLFIFLSVGDEIDVRPIIEKALQGGKRVFAPAILPGRMLEARELTSVDSVVTCPSQSWLLEPAPGGAVAAPEEIDLVIAPCVTCDPYGVRLGYGGGYYDKYLAMIRDDATSIALCRDRQLAMNLPAEAHDTRVGYIATESGIRPAFSDGTAAIPWVFIAATSNEHKIIELRAVLAPLGIEVRSYSDAGIDDFDVDETGDTFEANAKLKAEALYKLTDMATIADDSGLEVDALDGAPGIFSSRFSGDTGGQGKDFNNNQLLLRLLEHTPVERRTARFVSVIAACLPDGAELICRGECHGRIGTSPSGSDGFGYDPLFIPDEFAAAGLSFADITMEQKNRISHRAKALELFYRQLCGYAKQGERSTL